MFAAISATAVRNRSRQRPAGASVADASITAQARSRAAWTAVRAAGVACSAMASAWRMPLFVASEGLLDGLVGAQHAVQHRQFEDRAKLARGPRDAEIAAGQPGSLQHADDRTEPGAVHEIDVGHVYDQAALSAV